MKFRKDWYSIYVVFSHIAVIFLFLYGFLPLKNKSETFADWNTSIPTNLNGLK